MFFLSLSIQSKGCLDLPGDFFQIYKTVLKKIEVRKPKVK